MSKSAIIYRTERHYIVETTGLDRHRSNHGFKARYTVQTTDHEVLAQYYTEEEARAKVAALEALI